MSSVIAFWPGICRHRRTTGCSSADLFLLIEPRWAPFFDDEDSGIDWRLVGWGGVFIDDRPDATAGQICPRGCIPALDQPAVTDAEGGSWYPDDDLVFGIVIGRQARAYPKNIMEVHEMVNDTLGGRQIAIPYCTLCLSAQAYFTDDVGASGHCCERPGCCRDPTSLCMTSPRSPRSTRLLEKRSPDRCSTPRQAQSNYRRDIHLGGVARRAPQHHDHR